MTETISKTFEFGPGTSQTSSHYRTFYVPARSTVSVAVQGLTRSSGGPNIPVVIEVRQASAASIENTGPDGPLLATLTATAPSANVVAFQNQSFVSDFGCPSTWRVRVRTANGSPPPVRVSGTILFVYDPPPTFNVELRGEQLRIEPNMTIIKKLFPAPITVSGTFRIKAKWHTTPWDVSSLNSYHPLTVALLKPDGTVAASETGFSQHAPADRSPKVDFTFQATPQDAVATNNTGNWGIRVTNNSRVIVVEFALWRGNDMNPMMQDFNSTFTPRCS